LYDYDTLVLLSIGTKLGNQLGWLAARLTPEEARDLSRRLAAVADQCVSRNESTE
jgi:hypothetical protein